MRVVSQPSAALVPEWTACSAHTAAAQQELQAVFWWCNGAMSQRVVFGYNHVSACQWSKRKYPRTISKRQKLTCWESPAAQADSFCNITHATTNLPELTDTGASETTGEAGIAPHVPTLVSSPSLPTRSLPPCCGRPLHAQLIRPVFFRSCPTALCCHLFFPRSIFILPVPSCCLARFPLTMTTATSTDTSHGSARSESNAPSSSMLS